MIGDINDKYYNKLARKIKRDFDDNVNKLTVIQILINNTQYRLYAKGEYERTEFRLMRVEELNINNDEVITKETILYRGDSYSDIIDLLNKLKNNKELKNG